MTISIEQSVLGAMVERLNGEPLGPVPKPAGIQFSHSRMLGLKPDACPHGSLYPFRADEKRSGAAVEVDLETRLALWVKGDTLRPIDLDSDPLAQWARQQLCTDESLGGLAMRLRPGPRIWGFHLAASPIGDLEVTYTVTFRHHIADPSRPA